MLTELDTCVGKELELKFTHTATYDDPDFVDDSTDSIWAWTPDTPVVEPSTPYIYNYSTPTTDDYHYAMGEISTTP